MCWIFTNNLTDPRACLRWGVLLCIGSLLLVGCAHDTTSLTGPDSAILERTGHSIAGESDTAEPFPPGVTFEDGLTEEECIALALWNQPDFLVALSELGISRANIVEAGQLKNPSLSVLFPVGPKQLEFAAKFPIEALWLRQRRIELAELDYQRLAERLVQSGLNVRRDVQLAFTAVVRLRDVSDLLIRQASVWSKIAALKKEQLNIGSISERETTQAVVDSLKAAQATERARQDLIAGDQRLRLMVALDFWKKPIEWIHQSIAVGDEFDAESLIPTGLAARPEIRAAELAMEVNGRKAGLAKKEIYSVVAVLDANGSGSNFEIGPGLDVGLPIFNRNEGQVALAEAVIKRGMREYAAARTRVVGEIQKATQSVNRERVELQSMTGSLIPATTDLVNQTKSAHDAGAVSLLEVLKAELQLLEAQMQAIDARGRYQAALAELEHSVGLRLPDIKSMQTNTRTGL